jgi:hypothetical protein
MPCAPPHMLTLIIFFSNVCIYPRLGKTAPLTRQYGSTTREKSLLKPKWEYVSSRYSDKSHTVMYRDEVLRVQMQIVTKRSDHYNPEKAKYFYFIDAERRVFRSEDELLNALAKKFESEDRQRFSLITHWVRSVED